jgi:hypothetical protein
MTEVCIRGLPSHLQCRETANAGRSVFALGIIPKGTIALQEVPYCHTIHHRYKSKTCEHCFGFSSTELSHPCLENCGKRYCSLDCREIDGKRHIQSGSCGLSIQLNASNNSNSKLMNEALSLLVNTISPNSTARPISDVLIMIKDDSKKGKRDCKSAETKFRLLDHSSVPLPLENAGVYADVLSTRKMNAIGMFNEYGEETGLYLSPVVAMVNHSCLPNCQQVTLDGSCRLVALRQIEAGEELTWTYASILSNSAERRAFIAFNWEFNCACARCRDTAEDCVSFDKEHTCCCGSVCLAVDRNVEACVCNLPSIRC